jgi:hypothetical protein
MNKNQTKHLQAEAFGYRLEKMVSGVVYKKDPSSESFLQRKRVCSKIILCEILKEKGVNI